MALCRGRVLVHHDLGQLAGIGSSVLQGSADRRSMDYSPPFRAEAPTEALGSRE
jgi:hypothetical protein